MSPRSFILAHRYLSLLNINSEFPAPFLKKNIFIWLHWVLDAAHGIFNRH